MADLPAEDWAAAEVEAGRRRMDLAINLVEQYLGLVTHWKWGTRFWNGSGNVR